MSEPESVDVVVIGAGVVGLAVARALALAGREVLVIEQASAIGTQTSSRNSEVIHAGIYYPPGSLKATLCVQGREQLYQYCRQRQIPHRQTGKLLVAGSDRDRAKLSAIRKTAQRNGVTELHELSASELGDLEPQLNGVAALFSPLTGIVDSHALMLNLQGDLERNGGVIAFNSSVESATVNHGGIVLTVNTGEPYRLAANWVINAAGLQAVEVANNVDGFPDRYLPTAFFAKGHYFSLSGHAPFRHLIYPLPEPGGLGVHATLDLAGQLRFGPDVVWQPGMDYRFDETRKAHFVTAIRRYYPGLDSDRLHPAYTGVRPKIVGPQQPDGDFVISLPQHHGVDGWINLFGIESPGLTACLAIAEQVAGAVS